jgi:hypothetical protein
MRLRSSLFWGIILIVLATLLLFNQQGWLKGNIFGYFWPVVIIMFGIWLLIGVFARGRFGVKEQVITIPLEGAPSARIKMDHAAGRLNILAQLLGFLELESWR